MSDDITAIDARRADQVAEAIEIASNPQSFPVNVFDTTEAIVIVAALPGVMAEDISIAVEDGLVRIEAEMRSSAPKRYLLHEWHYGPYERTVVVPEGCGADAKASFGNGQLAVHLGKAGAPGSPLHLTPS